MTYWTLRLSRREKERRRDRHAKRERVQRTLQHTWPHHVTMQRLATVQHCNTHFSDKLLQVLGSQHKPWILLGNAPTIHPHALLFVCTGISIYGSDTPCPYVCIMQPGRGVKEVAIIFRKVWTSSVRWEDCNTDNSCRDAFSGHFYRERKTGQLKTLKHALWNVHIISPYEFIYLYNLQICIYTYIYIYIYKYVYHSGSPQHRFYRSLKYLIGIQGALKTDFFEDTQSFTNVEIGENKFSGGNTDIY